MSDFSQADLEARLRSLLDAPSGVMGRRIQSLWSGYGAIFRFFPRAGSRPSYIVKCVHPPTIRRHPRGFDGDSGHERKLRSYAVELSWYRDFSLRTTRDCRVPEAVHLEGGEGRWLFVLEDLDHAGFGDRRQTASRGDMEDCLRFLAYFHARFLGDVGEGLWKTGTYWHLETRPDELKVMNDPALRNAASEIDERLNRARYVTLVHGDAKLANFCFSQKANSASVAAVDFQYVGRGVGVKDVAYFLSSCLDERDLTRHADSLLHTYFGHLRHALSEYRPDVDAGELENEWRALYPFAWADFVRFLLGWAPEHYKIHGYSREMTRRALSLIGGSP